MATSHRDKGTSAQSATRARSNRRSTAPAARKASRATVLAAASERTLVAHFAEQVRTRPKLPALYGRGEHGYEPTTWGEFGRTARHLSALLMSLGIEPQQHVAIWSNNRPEWHIADMAIMQVRARPVPVYFTLSTEQAAYVLNHSESRVLFVEDARLLSRVIAAREQIPTVERLILMNGGLPADAAPFAITWADAVAAGRKLLGAHGDELDERIAAVVPADVATLIYTSGTTGPPKAVTLTHDNCASVADSLQAFVNGDVDERVLSYLPLAHIAERMVSEFRSYIYGNPTYFLDGFEHLGERLQEIRPTQFFGVPRVWEKMAQKIQNSIAEAAPAKKLLAEWAIETGAHVARDRAAGRPSGPLLRRQHMLADRLVLAKLRSAIGLDQARTVACGAAPIGADVLNFFASIGIEICEVYGQTEDCAVTTMNRPGLAKVGTVGTQLPGIEVRLAKDGEILVRGGNVFSGYYRDDEATRETLIDGWLHTGDVGEFDHEGYLRITDRKKDLIITAGGKNISPSNIEGLLKRNPLIANAVAIGDRRPFMTALLTLDAEEARRFASRHSLSQDLGELARDSTVRDAIEAHVREINEQLNHVEQVKKWAILPRDFTVGEELTPTLKVKRKVVTERYADEIEALYHR